MQRVVIPLLLFLVPPCNADSPIESEVFQTAGTQAEIAERGELCIAQLVRNDSVAISDAAPGTGILGALQNDPLAPKADQSVIPGGSVVIASDATTVVANNRLTVRERFAGATTFQSILTLSAQDGRFKLVHTDIRFAMANTGYAQNDGFQPIHPKAKMLEKATSLLQELSAKVATCIQQKADW
jgi:hypothetical protein